MDEMEFYNKHYIAIDELNRIVDGFSDAFRRPSDTDICINERGGYQFRLFPDGDENPYLYEWDGIPLYKWDGTVVLRRDAEEIEADRAAMPVLDSDPTTDELLDILLGVSEA